MSGQKTADSSSQSVGTEKLDLLLHGTEPLEIVAIFSQPGYEEYLREISVPEGQTPAPLSVAELAAIRARHLHSAVYEKP